MESLAGLFLAVIAGVGAYTVRNHETPERLYWWAGFVPYVLMGLAGAGVAAGVEQAKAIYQGVAVLAAVLGSVGILLAAVTRFLKPIPELWANIAFAITLGIVIASLGAGAAPYAGMVGLAILLGIVALGIGRFGELGIGAGLLAAGAFLLALAPMTAPALAQSVLTTVPIANIMFLQTALGLALIIEGARR